LPFAGYVSGITNRLNDLNPFSTLGVRDDFCQALTEMGILSPTPIQTQAIPLLMEKETDLVAQAQTGTGKTAAFGLPLLAKIDPSVPRIQCLVIAPTRELAKQIGKQLFRFTKYSARMFVEVLAGGDKIDRQVEALQRPTHIIVVTPGRLIDLLKRKALTLDHVRHLVLDEADEMLSMGFRKELQEILRLLTQRRTTWLFSATIPEGIAQLIREHMSAQAPHVKIDRRQIVNRKIEHQCLIATRDEKIERIDEFLHQHPTDRGLVFCRTREIANKVSQQLRERGHAVDVIHGDLMQTERDKVMRGFKKERIRVLITTDVSARGIDVPDLSFVSHHQLPDQLDFYTHRSGRTARAGKTGLSLALIDPRERNKIREMEQTLSIQFRERR
jgi:ATP-dependent RNA helicase DeaD